MKIASKNSRIWEHVETNLIRYRPTGGYYIKVKIHGKKVRESLDTDKLADARKKLAAWMTKVRGGSAKGKSASTMASLIEQYTGWLKNRIQASRTTDTRLDNLETIRKNWPNFDNLRVGSISRHDVEVWRDGMVTKLQYSTSTANQCLGTLKQMFTLAEAKGLLLHDPPTLRIKVLRQMPKKIQLPSDSDFWKLHALVYIRSKHGGQLFDFLRLTGCRIESSQHVHWGDIDWTANKLTFNKAKRGGYTIPLFAPLKEFLLKIKPANAKPSDRVTKVDSIKKTLTTSSKALKLPHMSHHDLRHWFCTKVLENAQIDVPTLSRWLGHKDGGALALRTYGHLRDSHSQAMAALVK